MKLQIIQEKLIRSGMFVILFALFFCILPNFDKVNAAYSNPQLVASLSDDGSRNMSNPQGMEIQGNYLIGVSRLENSLFILDISNPQNPIYISSVRNDSQLNNAVNIHIKGNYAYVSQNVNTSLTVVDITNKYAPTIVNIFYFPFWIYDFAIKDNYIYSSTQSSTTCIGVINISNPINPTYVTTVSHPSACNGTIGITVKDNYAYTYSTTGSTAERLVVIDISNPSSPLFISQTAITPDSNCIKMKIQGHILFCPGFKPLLSNFTTIDISNPASPVLLQDFNIPSSGLYTIGFYGNVAFSTGSNNSSLNLINTANPSSMSLIYSTTDNVNLINPRSIILTKNYLFISSSTSNQVLVYHYDLDYKLIDSIENNFATGYSNHSLNFPIQPGYNGGLTSSGDSITLSFPTEFNLLNLTTADLDLKSNSVQLPLASTASANTWGATIDSINNRIILTAPTSGLNYIVPGSVIEVVIGQNASYQAIGSNKIQNPLSQGIYSIGIEYTNSRGNESSIQDLSITESFPHTITINPYNNPTNSDAISITGNIDAQTSATNIAGVEFLIDGNSNDFYADWRSCTANDSSFDSKSEDFTCSLPLLSEGTHQIYFRAYDTDNIYTSPSGITHKEINIDRTAPTGSMLIDNGANRTIRRQVDLTISALDTSSIVTSMTISENPLFEGANNVPYTTNTTYTLSPSYGQKTIYIKFIDEAGNESETYSQNIEYYYPTPILPPIEEVKPICGNFIVEQGEECETTILEPDCKDQGDFTKGKVKCTTCKFDLSECVKETDPTPIAPVETTPPPSNITPPHQDSVSIKGVVDSLVNSASTSEGKVISAVTSTTSVVTSLVILNVGFVDLPAIFIGMVFNLLSIMRIRKKGKEFGVVYNAITKEPISQAIVRMFDENGKILRTEVTNAYGIFNSATITGKYRVVVQKSGFTFPSRLIKGTEDETYLNIYSGELLTSDNNNERIISIPIDPIKSPLNKILRTLIRLNLLKLLRALQFVIFITFFFFAIQTFSHDRSTINTILLGLYILSFIILVFSTFDKRMKFGRVLGTDKKALPNIQLGLQESNFNRLVTHRVTDEDGLYRFIVPKGVYNISLLQPDYTLTNEVKNTGIIAKQNPSIIAKDIYLAKRKI